MLFKTLFIFPLVPAFWYNWIITQTFANLSKKMVPVINFSYYSLQLYDSFNTHPWPTMDQTTTITTRTTSMECPSNLGMCEGQDTDLKIKIKRKAELVVQTEENKDNP